MSKKEGETKANVPVNPENSSLQAVVSQSTALPVDNLAKSQTTKISAQNISTLQTASQQCASLPKKPLVAREAFEGSSKENEKKPQ